QQPPQPYSFSFDNVDENGTRIAQQETGDENNVKTGSYSYTDPTGIQRVVKYVADATGFHVTVETNEPGTKTSNPADAQIVSSSVEGPAPAVVKAAPVPPQPYSFSYDNTDEFGTRISQEETGDENNNKVGSYSYTDPDGVHRTVKYVADADGFRVTVETNEPGTKTSNPADAQIVSSASDDSSSAAPAPVKAAPVVVKTYQQAAPITVHAVHATPVVHAIHAAPFALHAAPVSYATAHHVTPVVLAHAPLTYTLGRAKSA
ncbi:unnamed protein product, partial [Ixodes hexagonus]